MPEKGKVNNTETPLISNLSKALLLAGGIGVASILSTLAFNESGYWDIHDRDGRCRITGRETGTLQAAHIYHDDGVLGGYHSPENGLFLCDIAHAYQHWMIYKLGVEGQFGLHRGESLGSSISSLGAKKRDFRSRGSDGLYFPVDKRTFTNDNRLAITLLVTSWLLGLKGVLLDKDKNVCGHFCYGYDKEPKRNKYRIPKRGKDIPKYGYPPSAIIKCRELSMNARLAEVERVGAKLNGDGEYILERFVEDGRSGFIPTSRPDVGDLVSIYRAYRRLSVPNESF